MRLKNETVCSLSFGTEYTIEKNNGILFSRFSHTERETLTYGRDNSYSTAGIRLEFETDSKSLKISVSVKESNPHERSFYSFDVYNNNVMIGQIKNFDKSPQYPYKKYSLDAKQGTFKLSDKINHICIYFPWSVQGIINEIEIDDDTVSVALPDGTNIDYANRITVTVADKDGNPLKDISGTVSDKTEKSLTDKTDENGKRDGGKQSNGQNCGRGLYHKECICTQ